MITIKAKCWSFLWRLKLLPFSSEIQTVLHINPHCLLPKRNKFIVLMNFQKWKAYTIIAFWTSVLLKTFLFLLKGCKISKQKILFFHTFYLSCSVGIALIIKLKIIKIPLFSFWLMSTLQSLYPNFLHHMTSLLHFLPTIITKPRKIHCVQTIPHVKLRLLRKQQHVRITLLKSF